MNMYVIKNNDSNKYVGWCGEVSYTSDIRKAKLFNDYNEALRHKCENESIISLMYEFHDPMSTRGY